MQPKLEERGLTVGKDVFLAFSLNAPARAP
jgi:hypothetical protein